MAKIIKKKEFFNEYFKSINKGNTSFNKKIKKEIYNNIIDNVEEKTLEIVNKQTINMVINLELKLSINMFNHNFKENLIEYIKKKYESRAYYIFFLDFIDYNYITNYELPLIKKIGELMCLNIPILASLIIFKKNDIVEMKLILFSKDNDKIIVESENDYIHCKIILKASQIILKNNSKDIELYDKLTNKKYKNNDSISIKLIDFYNNQLEDCFTPKINCSGEINM